MEKQINAADLLEAKPGSLSPELEMLAGLVRETEWAKKAQRLMDLITAGWAFPTQEQLENLGNAIFAIETNQPLTTDHFLVLAEVAQDRIRQSQVVLAYLKKRHPELTDIALGLIGTLNRLEQREPGECISFMTLSDLKRAIRKTSDHPPAAD